MNWMPLRSLSHHQGREVLTVLEQVLWKRLLAVHPPRSFPSFPCSYVGAMCLNSHLWNVNKKSVFQLPPHLLKSKFLSWTSTFFPFIGWKDHDQKDP